MWNYLLPHKDFLKPNLDCLYYLCFFLFYLKCLCLILRNALYIFSYKLLTNTNLELLNFLKFWIVYFVKPALKSLKIWLICWITLFKWSHLDNSTLNLIMIYLFICACITVNCCLHLWILCSDHLHLTL